MAQYDLTHKLSGHLDRHLVLPLLDFHIENGKVFDKKDVQQSKLTLLSQTGMIDLAIDTHHELHGAASEPKELLARREEVAAELEGWHAKLEPIFVMFENEEALAKIQALSHQPEALYEALQPFGYSPDMKDTLYKAAKFYFDIGQYAEAAQFLYNFRVLSNDADLNFSALWGKLAAEILNSQWESALEDMNLLLEYIDGKNNFTPAQQLQQRAWLMHWSLFIFFNHSDTPEGLLDLFMRKEACCNALETVCTHLLRYVTVVAIIHRRGREIIRDIGRIVQKQDEGVLDDPVTNFLISLTHKFNFEEAQKQLKLCEEVLDNDVFLAPLKDAFLDRARHYIFEIYCQIHSTISIPMLAEKLGMTADKAEEWIVNLIREARLDAKIDSAAGHVVMSREVPSIYHQVIERTKGLSIRTQFMLDALKRQGKPRGHFRRNK
eukprot:m.9427 g.9427  ORF g.9427 m.9427 type:complete len:436 (+) comp9418_c0_seq1:30-1337(+)